MDNLPYFIIASCVAALSWMVRYQRNDAARGVRRVVKWFRR